jgi:uncharacterized membrane protein YcaP (DUF421 family)
MDLVIRAALIYLVLYLLLRASGNRQFSQLTAFDAVLLLIVSEAVQQALIGDEDFSLTAAGIIVITFIALDIALSLVKQASKAADMVIEGVPVLLVDNGDLIKQNMRQERVDEDDILAAARLQMGLESLDQVKYAVLERDGSIGIIPRKRGD